MKLGSWILIPSQPVARKALGLIHETDVVREPRGEMSRVRVLSLHKIQILTVYS